MAKEQSKKGVIERSAGFFERLHYAIGAVAIAGALMAPAELATPLVVFGAYEIVHGALWNWIKTAQLKSQKLL